MTIAIFHNLNPGGALNLLSKTSKSLLKLNHKIHIYSLNKFTPRKISHKTFLTRLPKTNNLIQHLFSCIFTEDKICKKIAKKIINKNYDLIIVFPSLTTQSPHILKYLPKDKTIYIFTEPKREYYEKTDFFNLRQVLSKYILFALKLTDISNCKNAKNIITISQYSATLLKKIYGKNSHTIYPGLSRTKQTDLYTSNKKTIISVGAISKLKGHIFSLKQTQDNPHTKRFTIIGKKTKNSSKIINQKNNNTVFLFNANNKQKTLLLNKTTFFLANQEREPYGIATLEAVNNNCFVIGKNEAGTSEIVRHGLDGFLYPNNLKLAKKSLLQLIQQDEISITKTSKMDWMSFTKKILSTYQNEPSY